jgi:capsule biosynthesis phosphatase
MIIIIPLGGIGERFKTNNYSDPKALIKIFVINFIFYLLENLNITDDVDFIYIPYNKEYCNYRLEDLLIRNFPKYKFRFFKLEKDTRGALETVFLSLTNLTDINLKDQPVLCLDADNFYTIDIIKKWNKKNEIFVFNDESKKGIYSYINHQENKITDIQEKNPISSLACSGAYGFESIHDLKKYAKLVIDNNILQKNEFYMSNVVKYMIDTQNEFSYNIISKTDYHCLGTPLQIRQFINNYPMLACINNNIKIKKLRICFDLDNTLITYPKIANDYTSVLPINKMIDYLKYLKTFGHTIIIYTARRMKTYEGNQGKVLANIGKITFDTLEKFDIPYDEIYFGKPYADYYIDDSAISAYDDIEKKLGFYNDKIDTREFNTLKYSIDTVTKSGKYLSSQIYYYNNIPSCLKDMFPIFINSNIDNTEYTIEKINGMTVTQLYLSELLTENTLVHIMNSIKRIQQTEIKDTCNINIYENYCKKLKERYDSYDYSKFTESKKMYELLYDKLYEYEINDKGKKTVIHGDPVMTNIIINEYEKIKFIDMRGIVGNTHTIFGDWLYDWAKLYQSLIGYDKILQNREISKDYEQKMHDAFVNYFINNFSTEDFNNLVIITKSLLFTLIPLHNDQKCVKYYNLIRN